MFLQEPKWSRQKINIVRAACERAKPAKPPPLDMYKRMRCVELVFPLWFKSNHGVFVSGSSSSNWQAQFNHNAHVTQKGASLESVT